MIQAYVIGSYAVLVLALAVFVSIEYRKHRRSGNLLK